MLDLEFAQYTQYFVDERAVIILYSNSLLVLTVNHMDVLLHACLVKSFTESLPSVIKVFPDMDTRIDSAPLHEFLGGYSLVTPPKNGKIVLWPSTF